MKNKKEHLKPAFILCGIVGLVIIAVFIASGNVNRNVAKNLKGKVLYTQGDSVVKEYDFDNGTEKVIGNGMNGHYVKTGIVYNDTDKIYINTGDDTKELYSLAEGQKFTAMAASGTTIAAVYTDGSGYMLVIYDIEKNASDVIAQEDEEIPAVCMGDGTDIYYTVLSGSDSVLNKISVRGGKPEKLLKGSNERIEYITYVDKMVLMCENKDGNTVMSRYSSKTSKAVELKFSSDKYNCVAAAAVYDEEYIVSSDKDGSSYRLFVCNGSNMVKIDDISADDGLVVSDYSKTE